MPAPVKLPVEGADDPWLAYWRSFRLKLEADGRSPHTIRAYHDGVEILRAWLDEHNRKVDPLQVTRADLQQWLVALRAQTSKQGTIHTRFSAAKRFYQWLEDEEEIERSPAARIALPRVEDPAPDVLTDDEATRLLKACAGKGFEQRRDMALISVMLDTGLRRSEAAGIALEDVDLESATIFIWRLKGGRSGVAYLGRKALADLDRYMRMRARHKLAELAVEREPGVMVHPLWLTHRGLLHPSGVYYVIRSRAAQAGIGHVHPHQARHTFGHSLKVAGVSDENVMALGRWRDATAMRRYGQSAAAERARLAHKLNSPRDRL